MSRKNTEIRRRERKKKCIFPRISQTELQHVKRKNLVILMVKWELCQWVRREDGQAIHPPLAPMQSSPLSSPRSQSLSHPQQAEEPCVAQGQKQRLLESYVLKTPRSSHLCRLLLTGEPLFRAQSKSSTYLCTCALIHKWCIHSRCYLKWVFLAVGKKLEVLTGILCT